MKVRFKDWDCVLQWGKYGNKQPALQLIDAENGEPIATASVSLDVELKPNEIIIKDWSENEGMLDTLVKSGIVEDTGEVVQTGFVLANVCRILKRG